MNNKFSIGIIGAGKVGAVLGAAYRACGHNITSIYTSSEENIERAEVLLPKVPVCSMEEVIAKSEIVFFTIPDDELEPTISGLNKMGVFKQGQIIIHTSGRCGLEVFGDNPKIIGMTLHPIMTFTGTSLDISKLKNASFGINAPKLMMPIAQALVMELEAMPVIINDEYRSLYHASLSHGANHLALIVTQSLEMLEKAGIENPEKIVKPLFEAALERAFMQRVKGISGPIPRGDAQTVGKHIQAFKEAELYENIDVYKILSKEVVRKCLEEKIINPRTAEKIMKIIKSETDREH